MNIQAGLHYTKDHEWIRVEGNKGYIGISDYAQHHMGDIVFVELPEVDAEVAVGDSIGVIESVKAASSVFSPVGGTIVEVNESLEETPEAINEDPYGNWIAVIEIADSGELDQLMSAEDYETYCENLEE